MLPESKFLAHATDALSLKGAYTAPRWNRLKTRLQGGAVGRRTRSLDANRLQAIGRPLLAWYSRAKRDLPWRRSRDPYAVWVSEIMLQQTQVERVRDSFVRFMAAFPDVHALANATEDEVLRLWEGLGYYRRARQLHAAAKEIVARHEGLFPRSVDGLLELPGIGRYTAGAIASIAMNIPAPILEANSRRVLARLAAHAAPPDAGGADAALWALAAAIVPRRHPGRFNQALMDLGAMVCTPRQPRCTACPLAACCAAHQQGREAEIPGKPRRRATESIRESAIVARIGDRVLVLRRGPGEWWEGLWDFPRLSAVGRGLSPAIDRSPLLGPLRCGPPQRLGSLTHSVTHHRIAVAVVGCQAVRRGRRAAGLAWVPLAKIGRLAMTSPGRRIAKLAAEWLPE